MSRARSLRRVLVVGAALSLLAAGCGDDDDDDDSTEPAETDAPVEETDAPVEETDAPVEETDAPVEETEAPDDGAAGGEGFDIADFQFNGPAEVPAGTTLTVINSDGPPHTLTADDGSFDTGNIAGGASAEVTFDTAGEFPFHCNVHPAMTGSITVT